jgi:hypothetical protein
MPITIDEAIGELKAIKGDLEPNSMPYACQAIQLGIEALKRIRDMRVSPILSYYNRLPGETEK